jgi:hypothetical protein
MGLKPASALALLLLGFPAGAGQHQESFRLGAVVVRPARVQTEVRASGSRRLLLAGPRAMGVQVDSGPVHLIAAADLALPPAAAVVTVHY